MASEAVNFDEQRITELEDEIREKQLLLAAYRRVAEDRKSRQPSQGEPNGVENKESEQRRFSWQSDNTSGAIRNAIRHLEAGKPFNLDQIDAWLRHNEFQIARKEISFVLYRLAKKGEIKAKQKGSGKRPTIYEPPSEEFFKGGPTS